MSNQIDMIGKKFGKLTCVKRVANRETETNRRYEFFCDCGNTIEAGGGNVRSGHTSSCGCLRRETVAKFAVTHGHASGGKHSPEYESWSHMNSRCRNKNDRNYKNYGGRGILVCKRWHKFENFLADMGPRPPGTSIERINNNRNYEPSNCEWATRAEQAINRRSNLRITHNGETKTLSEWAKHFGIHRGSLRNRIVRGSTFSEAISKPVNRKGWPRRKGLNNTKEAPNG